MDVFKNPGDQGPLYKGQMFKNKPTLKQAIGMHLQRGLSIGFHDLLIHDSLPNVHREVVDGFFGHGS